MSDGGFLIRVMEGDVLFVGGALGSSDGWHAATAGRGTCGRLRVDVIEDASGEPRVDEATTSLEQGVVVHPNVLFQGFETHVERGASSGLRAEPHDFRCDPWVVNGVDVLIHEFLQAV